MATRETTTVCATQKHQSYSKLFCNNPLSTSLSLLRRQLSVKRVVIEQRAHWTDDKRAAKEEVARKILTIKPSQLLKFRSPVQKDFYSYALACNAYWKRSTRKERNYTHIIYGPMRTMLNALSIFFSEKEHWPDGIARKTPYSYLHCLCCTTSNIIQKSRLFLVERRMVPFWNIYKEYGRQK